MSQHVSITVGVTATPAVSYDEHNRTERDTQAPAIAGGIAIAGGFGLLVKASIEAVMAMWDGVTNEIEELEPSDYRHRSSITPGIRR